MEITTAKSDRLLKIYARLQKGETLGKAELAQQFHVTQRSVQRDIESLRCFLADQRIQEEVIYDRRAQGYQLRKQNTSMLTNSEALAVCKILLESRSLRRDEMLPILDKLVANCIPAENSKAVAHMVANEKFHYLEPHHGQTVLEGLWEIGQAVQNHQLLEITYERLKEPKLSTRVVEPVGIMFSEYYFYLTAYSHNIEWKEWNWKRSDRAPTVYRIDRIRSFKVLDEHFHVPYAERFEEGEFRKRVQFMYAGKLQRVRFCYTGPLLEPVLDRLPTVKVVEQTDDGWLIEAEVFGNGIEMWLRSQGDYVQIIDGRGGE